MSSTFGKWRALNAVDGELAIMDNFTDQERTCAHTNMQSGVRFWQLNLPTVVDAVQINIFNRVNHQSACCEERLQGFKMVLKRDYDVVFTYSDSAPKGKEVYELAFPARIPPFQSLTLYPRSTSEALSICEVEVFGEAICREGFYGDKCHKRCNCHLGHGCIAISGACPDGCKAGYMGTDCRTECRKYFYGVNCRHDCRLRAHCKEGRHDRCDRVTGACLTGCQDGWVPPLCDNFKCEPGLFGPDCLYECHCMEGAVCHSVTGECHPKPDARPSHRQGHCALGWFGPGCQHKRVEFYARGSAMNGSPPWLADQEDDTCSGNEKMERLRIILQYPIYVKLLRIKARRSASFEFLRVELITSKSKKGSELTCSGFGHYAQAGYETRDFICPSKDSVTGLEIIGQGAVFLCGVYLSAGRIVAKEGLDIYKTKPASGGHNYVAHYAAPLTQDTSYRVHFQASTSFNVIHVITGRDECPDTVPFKLSLKRLDDDKVIHTFGSSTSAPSPNGIYSFTAPGEDMHGDLKYLHIESLKNTFLSICRVEIMGDTVCPLGKHGLTCEENCSCANESDGCFSSGGCASGCRSGYTALDCKTPCGPGQYGSFCRNKCGNFCIGGNLECRTLNGHCTIGCIDGYQPPFCVDRCNLGNWGLDCMFECGEHCKGGLQNCDPVNGFCYQGCEPGYLEPLCEYECMDTYFGAHCNTPCSENCKDNKCRHVSGTCLNCEPGRSGDFCEVCPKHKYGRNCSLPCREICLNQTCDPPTGHCLSCYPGYIGNECEDECPVGLYGQDCSFACSAYCVGGLYSCNHKDGVCLKGCEENMLPPLCQEMRRLKDTLHSPDAVSIVKVFLVLVLLIVLVVLAALHDRFKLLKSQEEARVSDPGRKEGRTARLLSLFAGREYMSIWQSQRLEGGQNSIFASLPSSSKDLPKQELLPNYMDPTARSESVSFADGSSV
ncbi:hypothetical protein RRG08_042106 [Elysia crispata]|uniref:Laminin EGF-like domain-containing protein n=1 Tax=Elysia crispata TaxID=231223 RepID=A0AAE1D814_9GAST|nr:hypothetical protein RRG08_042106 [Elysia crispata]